MTVTEAEYAGKRKQARKELFLIEMDQVVAWKGLIALVEPHYPKGQVGRPAYPACINPRKATSGLSVVRPDSRMVFCSAG